MCYVFLSVWSDWRSGGAVKKKNKWIQAHFIISPDHITFKFFYYTCIDKQCDKILIQQVS